MFAILSVVGAENVTSKCDPNLAHSIRLVADGAIGTRNVQRPFAEHCRPWDNLTRTTSCTGPGLSADR
jgi:hypothetical protein